ncbi:hypothetical protein JRC04_05190 [Mycolicibacterium sp. S2-37]|uniref:hypothetical protein n=1 Tax=Mycolicibacterium sp. S2-37 TaxID=2810297 RepID=UPI001A950A6B|nr:hypothetical protein [Mycolicibacterium sp. S2-37]MBO0676852.1 hypothetical protein [Mycolicibacterium sp. S2-37]
MTHQGNNNWLGKWLRREPHQIIGSEENPYLKRWYVLPRNRFLNLYLHQFLRSDDDRALHDHPWWFASLILKGGYWEHRGDRQITTKSWRQAGTVAFRRPTVAHRVELDWDVRTQAEKPTWTVILTGPRIRPWGFHCPQGWVHWVRFTHHNGCGEHA